MKNPFLILSVVIFWIFQTGSTDESSPELPEKKVSRIINRIWKKTDFQLDDLSGVLCKRNGHWYEIISENRKLGLLYNGRVNSCRAGGCSIEPEDETALAFEFFDYLLITDTAGEVLRINVYNYQATHGQEVMSRGWLNQFKGMLPGEKPEFGTDIEAISGATVSARAITEDIQKVLNCLDN